jgi:heme/copper-type cytochrome/quinol oxidase subunit 2
MDSSSASDGVTFRPTAETLRYSAHVIVGLAIALIAPFTGLAWPFALLVGMSIGSAQAATMRGEPSRTGDEFVRGLAVTGGVLAMLFLGAIIGGLIALVVVALASFSERAAAHASPTDRGVARILLFVVPAVTWVALLALGVNVDVRIGS